MIHQLRFAMGAIAFCCAALASAASEWTPLFTQAPAPPNDLAVEKLDETSRTFRLRFRALPADLPPDSEVKLATYVIASRPSVAPVCRILSCRFSHIRHGVRVAETDTVPKSFDGTPRDAEFMRVSPGGVLRRWFVSSFQLVTQMPEGVDTTDYWRLEQAEISVDIGAPPEDAQAPRWPKNDAFSYPALLNSDIDAAYEVPPSSEDHLRVASWQQQLNQALARGPVFRLSTYRRGLHRLPPQVLAAARGKGVLLLRQGVAHPVLALPPVPGGLFYFLPDWDVAQDGAEVLFAWPDADAPSPETIAVDSSMPADSSAAPSVHQHTEERLADYFMRLQPQGRDTKWIMAQVQSGQVASVDLTLPSGYNASGSPATLTLMAGPAGPIHFSADLSVYINGHEPIVARLEPRVTEISVSVPGEWLKPGLNRVSVQPRYAADSPGDAPPVIVQRAAVKWEQAATASSLDGARLLVGPAAGRPAGQPVAVQLPASASALQWFGDTTAGLVLPKPQSAAVQVSVSPLAAWAEWIDPASAPLPLCEQLTSTRSLFTPEDTDLLVVAAPENASGLSRWLQTRKTQGWHPFVALPQDIYDLYSYGRVDPRAIASWVKVALASPVRRPRALVLVGEASDWRGDPALLPPGATRSQIPTWGHVRNESFHGDHGYGTLLGADEILDLTVGRWPVSTAQQTAALADKILNAEASNLPAPDLLVSDDNPEFGEAADEAIAQMAPGDPVAVVQQSASLYEPFMKVVGKRRSPIATADLVDKWNAGAGILTYFGHGGPNVWSHERLFHYLDLPRVAAPRALPFVACASCDNAWLDYPVAPVASSMGERLVTGAGGALAVFGPVAGASPYEHKILMAALAQARHRYGVTNIGELALFAKNQFWLGSRSAQVPQQYVLVGDPTSHLPRLSQQGGLSVQPSLVSAGLPATLTVASAITTYTIVRTDGAIVATGSASPQRSLPWPASPAGEYRLDVRFADGTIRSAVIHVVHQPSELLGPDILPLDGMATFTLVTLADHPAPRVTWDGSGKVSINVDAPAPVDNGRLARQIHILGDAQSSGALVVQDGDTTLRRLVGRYLETVPGAGGKPTFDVDARPPLDPLRTLANHLAPVVSVRVRNRADKVWPNLDIRLESDGTESTLQRLAQVNPGEARLATLQFPRPFAAGLHLIVASLKDPSSMPATALAELAIPVLVRKAPQLEFLPGSGSIEVDGAPTARQTIAFRARLRNRGEMRAPKVILRAYRLEQGQRIPLESLNEEYYMPPVEMPAGAERDVLFRWENATESTGAQVLLVADKEGNTGNSTAGEATYAFPPVPINPLPDLVMESVECLSPIVAPGQRVQVRFKVSDSARQPRGPIEVEFGLRNPLTGHKVSRRTVLPSLEKPVSIDGPVVADGDVTECYAACNPGRDWPELDLANNEKSAPILLLADGALLQTSATGSLALCNVSNLEWIPDQGLRSASERSTRLREQELTLDNVISFAARPDQPDTDVGGAASWAASRSRVTSILTNAPSDLVLRAPSGLPDGLDVPVQVKVLVSAGLGEAVSGSGAFSARLGLSGDLKPLSFSAPAGAKTCWVDCGTTTTHQGQVRLRLRAQAGSSLQVLALRVESAAPVALSPAWRLSAGSFRLRPLGGDKPLTGPVQFRIGSLTPQGPEWKPFALLPTDGRLPTMPKDALLQWRWYGETHKASPLYLTGMELTQP